MFFCSLYTGIRYDNSPGKVHTSSTNLYRVVHTVYYISLRSLWGTCYRSTRTTPYIYVCVLGAIVVRCCRIIATTHHTFLGKIRKQDRVRGCNFQVRNNACTGVVCVISITVLKAFNISVRTDKESFFKRHMRFLYKCINIKT